MFKANSVLWTSEYGDLEPYYALTVAIIRQALKDTERKQQFEANDAKLWLLSEGVTLAETAGIEPYNFRKKLKHLYQLG